MELRKKMEVICLKHERYECNCEDDYGRTSCYPNLVTELLEVIHADALEQAEKAGLRPENPYTVRDLWNKPFESGVDATIAKLMPWHEADKAVAVKAERERILDKVFNILTASEYNDCIRINGEFTKDEWQTLKGDE